MQKPEELVEVAEVLRKEINEPDFIELLTTKPDNMVNARYLFAPGQNKKE